MNKSDVCFRLLDHRRLWNRIVLLLMEGLNNSNAMIFKLSELADIKYFAFSEEFGVKEAAKIANWCWACEYARQSKGSVKARCRCDCCPLPDNVCNDDDNSLYGKLADLIDSEEHHNREGLERAISLARQIRDTAVKDEIKTI